MAQRSATARSKLDKITHAKNQDHPPSGHPSLTRASRQQKLSNIYGGARLGSGGLLTPSASSVSGSSRTSLQLPPPQRVTKGALRTFLEAKGEKIRRGLGHGHKREASSELDGRYYTGLGGGMGSTRSRGSMSTIGEEKVEVLKWEGRGSRGEAWDGGGREKKDLELWFPDGDTLVYLAEKPLPHMGYGRPQPSPQPSFKLHSSVLRHVGSPLLDSLLDESARENLASPVSPASSAIGSSAQPMDYEYHLRRSQTSDTLKSLASTVDSQATQDSVEAGVVYRLYLPVPGRLDKLERHRYQFTTRNFFAVLFNKPLVGITLGQTLIDLTTRLDEYLSPLPTLTFNAPAASTSDSLYPDFLGTVTPSAPPTTNPRTHHLLLSYLRHHEFDDVRSNPSSAAALLIYTEHIGPLCRHTCPVSTLRAIESLYREAFVHATGLLPSLQLTPEWALLSPITKALLDRASLDIQVRVSKADSHLSTFDFPHLLPATSPSRLAFDKFQKFLIKHYSARFGAWPTPPSRPLYLHLQRDFAALHDYLVDATSTWHPPLPAASTLLASWDRANSHPPLPHPLPLLPAPPPAAAPKRPARLSVFPPHHAAPAKQSPAAALALSEATNIHSLMAAKTTNPLVDAFSQHERAFADNVSVQDARIGRWCMVYAVLQTLARVDVLGAAGTRWRDGVEYWLGARLRGTPPWGCVEGEADEAGGRGVEGRVELEVVGVGGVEEGEEGDDEGSPEPEERAGR